MLYFAPAAMDGDVDNIVNFILDGMLEVVYLNVQPIERVIVQKIEPGFIVEFVSITGMLEEAVETEPPVVDIRTDDGLGWRKPA